MLVSWHARTTEGASYSVRNMQLGSRNVMLLSKAPFEVRLGAYLQTRT